MNIDEKKSELRKYKYYQEELERLYLKLNQIRQKCYDKSDVQAVTYSDMPKGGTSPDMADEIAKMIDLERDIIKEILGTHEKIKKLDKAIDNLQDTDLIRVIKLKYFNRYSIPQIARQMFLSESAIKKKHKEALLVINL